MTNSNKKINARAYDLISAALQSGTIALSGPATNPQKNGENDAK